MMKHLESILYALFKPKGGTPSFSIFDPISQFGNKQNDDSGVAQALNAAFLIALAGRKHPMSELAKGLLARMKDSSLWGEIAGFYLKGIELVYKEIKRVYKRDTDFADRLESLYDWVSNREEAGNGEEAAEKIWAVFFTEANGILGNRQGRIKELREKRAVTITELNSVPITDPTRQIIFTSNVLLTTSPPSKPLDDISCGDHIKEKLLSISREQQLYWYDHPIQVGVEPEKNEVIYGLRGLEKAIEFERERGNVPGNARVTCLLSVSVTHRGLHDIAKMYLEEELTRSGRLQNIDLYVFTEADTRLIISEILAPAAGHYLKHGDADNLLDMFGVDGEYGRHYNFLKAIAAFWSVLIQQGGRATFKIDLDQVFPQKELVKQTGASAFEHLRTPLWGARGLDSSGQPLELGMIAGALVNESDIDRSLFTPDVPFPDRGLAPEEHIFYSILPQALSTEAEMITRYMKDGLDGKRRCIQRIHVTGGTNGILIESLRRYRPFTPSFMGRAEDQAYILSVLLNQGSRLAYVHKDGLIMRHDKEAFAQEAIQSAYAAKLVGDYVRLLYYSAYANELTADVQDLKDIIDPFTGCFVSKIPVSVVYLRFGLKASSFFSDGRDDQGLEFIRIGAKRITEALDFVCGKDSRLKHHFEKERLGWNLYYDTLTAMEDGLKTDDSFAKGLQKKARRIIKKSNIK